MSNQPSSADTQNSDLNLGHYLRIAAVIVPIVLILVVIVLALMGPAIGNVYSNYPVGI